MRADLHFHLLPDVDDGPATVEESLALARHAVADGTALVVATPHARMVDVATIPARVRELRRRLASEQIPLRVLPGLEIAQDDVAVLADDELRLVAHGPAGARWLLLEAPISGDPNGLLPAAEELMRRGYGVLIGHPERCRGLMGFVDELLATGAALQLNGSSLTGRHGDDARAWAIELALSGRAAVVSSDAHGADRGPVLGAAVAVLTDAGLPPAAAEQLVSRGPLDLLDRGLRRRAREAAPRAARGASRS